MFSYVGETFLFFGGGGSVMSINVSVHMRVGYSMMFFQLVTFFYGKFGPVTVLNEL